MSLPMTTDPATPDPVAATLAEIREREQAATAGPWWFDEDELMWRLHGVHAVIPEQMDGLIPEQVMNHQILKAPKSGTRYAEYWPGAADAAFITNARTDVPRLAAALEAVLALAADWSETGAKLAAAADRAAERGALPERTNLMDGRAQAHQDCAAALRDHVRTALLGETGQSLGEQPHPAAHCNLGGRPHPGPCTDPEGGTDG